MRIPGRRHWTESVDLYRTARTTSGRDTGRRTRTLVKGDVACSVQPVSNAEMLRHGIETSNPVFWCRYAGDPLDINDEVDWNGFTYSVVSLSRGQDVDVQLMMELMP